MLFHLGASNISLKKRLKTDSNSIPKSRTCGDEQTLQQTYSPKGSARCVQNFDDSLDFAIRMTYRISLRSSSLWEPRHPLLKVLVSFHRIIEVPKQIMMSFNQIVWLSHL